jgi:hypothetical protein
LPSIGSKEKTQENKPPHEAVLQAFALHFLPSGMDSSRQTYLQKMPIIITLFIVIYLTNCFPKSSTLDKLSITLITLCWNSH